MNVFEGRVTRNVPPRRCTVRPGTTIQYAGKTYTGDGYFDANLGVHVSKESDSFLCGEGAAVDEWERSGLVTVEEQSADNIEAAIDAWNGTEGDAIRETALALVDAHLSAHNERAVSVGMDHLVATRDHDHGFSPYTVADEDQVEMDITRHRQRLAQGGHSESS